MQSFHRDFDYKILGAGGGGSGVDMDAIAEVNAAKPTLIILTQQRKVLSEKPI